AGDDALAKCANFPRQLALVSRLSRRVPRYRSEHARRRVADAEQAALSFRDDLELHGRLVEARLALLELSKRGPLCLANRLPCRFDLQLAHRRAFCFFFRFTRRGCAGGFGFGRAAPSPASGGGSSCGGVRDERFGIVGGGVFGMSRRVTRPCPTVQRFVVIQ